MVVNRLKNKSWPPPPIVESKAELEAKRDELYLRLESGDAYINKLDTNNPDRERLINGWINLLRQYEEVCRQLWRL